MRANLGDSLTAMLDGLTILDDLDLDALSDLEVLDILRTLEPLYIELEAQHDRLLGLVYQRSMPRAA